MRSREIMVDDVPIIIFIEKLKKLLVPAEGIILFAPLRKKVDTIVNELEKLLIFPEKENATSELMDQLLPILYSAEYIIESFLIKTKRRRKKGVGNKIKVSSFVFAPWSQLQLSWKMNEIEKRIRAVSSTYDETHSNSPLHHYDETVDWNAQALGHLELPSNSPQHHYDETLHLLIGCENNEKELVHRLIKDKEESLRVISLVSEESLGKTALAKKVYNRLEIRQHFQCRVWVPVPEDFTYKDLLLIIIAQIPIDDVKDVELMNEKQLSEMLFKIFMGVKFLIVLDTVPGVSYQKKKKNVPGDDLWHKLVRPFADMANGSRVILTTRNANVASQVDPWSTPVNLARLTDEDSWALFLNKVKVGTPEENSFKVKILSLCHGMPPAIILLGGVLSTMGVSEWSSVIDHLSNLRGEDDHSVPLPSIVALSYRKLPFVLRPCFVYLALFPKMYEIPIRRLLHLWLAEGFVQTSTNETSVVSEPEDVAQVFLNELVRRNMIEIATRKLDGSPKTCRLPCFLHDIFLSKAEDIGFLHVHHCKSDCTYEDSPSNNFFIHRLADQYYGRVKSTSESHTHNLCSYLMFEIQKRNTSNKKIKKLLKRIMNRRSVALLKVFDIERIYRPVLPDKMGELQNLTYIGLRWTGLYSCPASIGDLPCLETLDLKYTNITTLPSSIWKAQKLRHLYMNEVSIEKPSKQPSTDLQTLVGLRINSKDPDEYGLTQLTNLRKLQLTCNAESVQKTVNCISGLVNLQTLKLRSRDSFGLPLEIDLAEKFKVPQSLISISLFGEIKGGIANLPLNLKTLALSMSKLGEDQMQLLGQLPKLNILVLLARSYSGKKMEYSPGIFPELHVLKLWKLEHLQEWAVKEGGLPKLEEIEIRDCEKLKKFEGSEHLHALKELVLTNMPKDFVEAVGKKSVKEKLVTNEWRFDEKVKERAASSSSLV